MIRPHLPAVASARDAQGRITIRAVRLTTPLTLDGRLDEEIYQGNSNTLPSPSGFRTSVDRDFGVDVKYGLTKTLAADVTYNTDFAQAEVDDQQINLTRFRWEYRPGSDFFLVYSEGRDTAVTGFPGLSNRQVVAKFTRLFRF